MGLLQTTALVESSTGVAWLAVLICLVALGALVLQHFVYRRKVRRLREQLDRAEAEKANCLDRDPLTGLLSRVPLEKRLEEERASEPGVVAVADLDDFKLLNASLGHLGGDEILRAIGRLIAMSIRQEDTAYRWGGDEFVIVFRHLDPQGACQRMSEIEERLRHFHIRNYGEAAIRWSWGVAKTGGRSLRESVAEADRAMYDYKHNRLPAGP